MYVGRVVFERVTNANWPLLQEMDVYRNEQLEYELEPKMKFYA